MFVAPLQGDKEIQAATQVGFNVTPSLHSVRVMGVDLLGIIAQLTQMLADEGINLRGVSAALQAHSSSLISRSTWTMPKRQWTFYRGPEAPVPDGELAWFFLSSTLTA
nr:hypothetical protein [Paraburkholderia sp. BL10I2N1]